MTSIRNTVQQTVAAANDTALDVITGLQTRIVDANAQLAAVVAGRTPDLPSWLPAAKLPQAPNPRRLVEQGFAFQAKLLEANRNFSVGLLEAWAEAAPQPSATPTPKTSKPAKK
jgi:hypothetical protein